MESQLNVRTLFATSQTQRKELDAIPDSGSALYQENLQAAIATLEECRRIADRISMFSGNESEDDIPTGDLQYLLIDYYLAQLILQDTKAKRKAVLLLARETYERYIHLLDTYSLLSKSDTKLFESYLDGREEFSLISTTDFAARRDTKIARLKQEKVLKLKLEYLAQVPQALQNDDAALREIYLTETQLCAHRTFHALDMIAKELKILALMPSTSPATPENAAADYRQPLSGGYDNYSERVDPPLSQLLNGRKAGPILSKDGKPLKPFTLLDSRQRLRDGVFRPDHSLPTMTIDEYLEEEKRRGGMIEGGGEQSGRPPEPDEEDYEKADIETMKAREWDEFTEANPKGSGNTLNRG